MSNGQDSGDDSQEESDPKSLFGYEHKRAFKYSKRSETQDIGYEKAELPIEKRPAFSKHKTKDSKNVNALVSKKFCNINKQKKSSVTANNEMVIKNIASQNMSNTEKCLPVVKNLTYKDGIDYKKNIGLVGLRVSHIVDDVQMPKTNKSSNNKAIDVYERIIGKAYQNVKKNPRPSHTDVVTGTDVSVNSRSSVFDSSKVSKLKRSLSNDKNDAKRCSKPLQVDKYTFLNNKTPKKVCRSQSVHCSFIKKPIEPSEDILTCEKILKTNQSNQIKSSKIKGIDPAQNSYTQDKTKNIITHTIGPAPIMKATNQLNDETSGLSNNKKINPDVTQRNNDSKICNAKTLALSYKIKKYNNNEKSSEIKQTTDNISFYNNLTTPNLLKPRVAASISNKRRNTVSSSFSEKQASSQRLINKNESKDDKIIPYFPVLKNEREKVNDNKRNIDNKRITNEKKTAKTINVTNIVPPPPKSNYEIIDKIDKSRTNIRPSFINSPPISVNYKSTELIGNISPDVLSRALHKDSKISPKLNISKVNERFTNKNDNMYSGNTPVILNKSPCGNQQSPNSQIYPIQSIVSERSQLQDKKYNNKKHLSPPILQNNNSFPILPQIGPQADPYRSNYRCVDQYRKFNRFLDTRNSLTNNVTHTGNSPPSSVSNTIITPTIHTQQFVHSNETFTYKTKNLATESPIGHNSLQILTTGTVNSNDINKNIPNRHIENVVLTCNTNIVNNNNERNLYNTVPQASNELIQSRNEVSNKDSNVDKDASVPKTFLAANDLLTTPATKVVNNKEPDIDKNENVSIFLKKSHSISKISTKEDVRNRSPAETVTTSGLDASQIMKYSPPILPILPAELILGILEKSDCYYSDLRRWRSNTSWINRWIRNRPGSESLIMKNIRRSSGSERKKSKISFAEYKQRLSASRDSTNLYIDSIRKSNRKRRFNTSDKDGHDFNYDSDATVKL